MSPTSYTGALNSRKIVEEMIVKKSVAERGVVTYVAAPPVQTTNDSLSVSVTVLDSCRVLLDDAVGDSDGVFAEIVMVVVAISERLARVLLTDGLADIVNVCVSEANGCDSVAIHDSVGDSVNVLSSEWVYVSVSDRAACDTENVSVQDAVIRSGDAVDSAVMLSG